MQLCIYFITSECEFYSREFLHGNRVPREAFPREAGTTGIHGIVCAESAHHGIFTACDEPSRFRCFFFVLVVPGYLLVVQIPGITLRCDVHRYTQQQNRSGV